MGRELQKKKNKSSIHKVSRRNQNRKKTRIVGSSLVAAQWDNKQTLSQNYKRLGLTHRLNTSAGGKELSIKPKSSSSTSIHTPAPVSVTEAIILRSPSGRIIGVEHQDAMTLDTLDTLDDAEDNDEHETTDLVKALEDRSARGITKVRTQSEREQDWIASLVEKHGDDYEAMFRDRKLNVMQQSIGDLKKRIKKWKGKN